ncbi:PREDICTED: integral membrane protein GPR155 [Ceratosolen solmsi marchali]|uniref:Integral membrane protein GPR155 n=1 Tax=Ceratosolen solmsi marchali TaxID=326594 RepID=A0AAJ6YPZ0_9HYME|nr:PREDICTED: integral membrane protein GPR155 [Ceratosolen solmsi marchali]
MNTSLIEQDSPLDSLYLALGQCFGIIICGYIAGRLEVITKTEANGLNTFIGTFSLPALIFLSIAKLDFLKVNWKFLLAVFIAKSIVFFVVLIISIISTRPSNFGRSALFAIFTTQSNDFAIGYPMINALYGSSHPEYSAYLYLMAPISLVALNPIGFVFLEIAKRHQGAVNNLESNNIDMFKAIVKGIAFNPVLLMTFLGILGNIIFNHNLPTMIQVLLEVFGNAFSATALFLLGLMMVGKIHKLKGGALVIPGILILIKLIVLPLIIRESVIFLSPGDNVTETSDLSTFGFLYGTIPTAPALFIFTLRYNIDIDLIASAMVVCTFLAAPLIFISAKLINAIGSAGSPVDYAEQLKVFSLDTSAASTTACLWLLICFIIIKRKTFQSETHRCTLCLILAQFITGVGVIIWARLDDNSIGTFVWYAQFILITLGVYASRFLTAAIAITLLFLNCQTTAFIENLQKWLLIICWGVPVIIISLICLTVIPVTPTNNELNNPNFQFGRVQVAVSILILVFCFFVTVGCLVLRQRYYERNVTLSTYSNLSSLVTNSGGLSTGRNIVDVEDLLTTTNRLNSSGVNLNDCPNELCGTNEDHDCNRHCQLENENETETLDDRQVLRHLVLLILLLCSMFIGLAMSVATLIMEQMTGVYTELAFLDVALVFGQSLISFGIFGLDPGLGALSYWLRNILRKCRMEKELQLPDEDSLSPEVKAFREQFRRCYLLKCQARIAACRRHLLRTYTGVFTGSDLVSWLIEAGIASDREEATYYGRCLLDSRVLNHIDSTQHFYDRNFLYTFRG